MLDDQEAAVYAEHLSLRGRLYWSLAYLDVIYSRNYKRGVSVVLLSLQYVLAILSVVFEDVEPVVYAYGINSALNGFLLSTQRFYFQIEPLVLNEVFFDSLFLLKLLFVTNLAGGDPEAQTFLYCALGFALLSFVGFLVAYWLVFPKVTVVSWSRLSFKFEQREVKRFVRLDAFLHVVCFTLTDSADVIILMTQVLLLNVLVDAKIVLFVIFLLLNPLMSQLGKFTTVRKDEKEELILPPKEDEELDAEFRLREIEFLQRVRVIKSAEEHANGKNVALTGLMGNLVLPVLYTASGLLANPSTPEWQIAVWCFPVYTALPLWILWEILGIPWDRYYLFNDVFRSVATRVLVVCWGIAIVVIDALQRPEAIVISAALLLYTLLPVSILLGEAYLRRTRIECRYRGFKPIEDMGKRLLFRSRTEDRIKYLYDPPTAVQNYYVLTTTFGGDGVNVSKRFDKALNWVERVFNNDSKIEDLNSYVIGLRALTFMYTNCFERGFGEVPGSGHIRIKDLTVQLERIIEIGKKVPNSFKTTVLDVPTEEGLRSAKLRAREAWYLWSEVVGHMTQDEDFTLALHEYVMENPELQITGIEPYGESLNTFGHKEVEEGKRDPPKKFTAEQLNTVVAKNKALGGFSFHKYPADMEAMQHVDWRLAKRMTSLAYNRKTMSDDVGAKIVENLPPRLKYFGYGWI